jgi:hypothetical protein
VPTGLEHLRDAARLAAGRADERLHATALFALGGSLVHAVAAHAVEGTQALREAARLARRAGDHRLVAEALRDLAYVENASGRVEPTRRLLPAAAAAAGGDAGTLSSVRAIEGMFLADRGAHGRALRALRESAHLAESTGRTRQAAWSLGRMVAVDRQPVAAATRGAGRRGRVRRAVPPAGGRGALDGDAALDGGRPRRPGPGQRSRGPGRTAPAAHMVAGPGSTPGRRRPPAGSRSPPGFRAKADVSLLAALAAGSQQPEFAARANLHRAALGASSAR